MGVGSHSEGVGSDLGEIEGGWVEFSLVEMWSLRIQNSVHTGQGYLFSTAGGRGRVGGAEGG
jgi:hypothetical protein